MPHFMTLIDANNFYVSCEQTVDPSLIKRPVIILSNNDGCVIARSPEARGLGIHMGSPYFKIKSRVIQLGVVIKSSNYELYGDISQRLMTLLGKYCEELEIYSIDEAFASINRPENHDILSWAKKLRALIYKCIGIPIAIGLGSNKVQAKLANYLAKNTPSSAGVFNLPKGQEQDNWLEKIEIEDVWGIGRKTSRWCRLRGVNTALQLKYMPSNELRMQYGVTAIRIQRELQGDICLPLTTKTTQRKSICVSRSFSRPIDKIEELRQAICTYIVLASQKLRDEKLETSSISIFANNNPYSKIYRSQTATKELGIASNDTFDLIKEALALTGEIFNPSYRLTKAGVIMNRLTSIDCIQYNLIISQDKKKTAKRKQLLKTIDKLNRIYGKGTIIWASCGIKPKWEMSRKNLSNMATTRITDIPTVKAG